MVAIRLSRTGAKKKPSYRVVVMDKRRARDSRNLEIVGHYNPRPDPIELVLKRDRIDYWIGVGAQPSDTVRRLVKHYDSIAPAPPAEETNVEAAAVAEEPSATPAPAPEAGPVTPGQPVEPDASEEADVDIDEEVETAAAAAAATDTEAVAVADRERAD